MPLAFSFFNNKTAFPPAAKPQVQDVQELWAQAPDLEKTECQTVEDTADKFPFKVPEAVSAFAQEETKLIESSLSPRNEVVLPLKRDSVGLAALAVNQSDFAAPPLNRRPQTPFPAAPEKQTGSTTPYFQAPVTDSWQVGHTEQATPNYETIKNELYAEIDLVKGDLFGAAMGVSALKDRLDGLETEFSQQSSTKTAHTISKEQIQSWVSEWLEAHLPEAIENALSKAQQKAVGSLGTQQYFRLPVTFVNTDRNNLFSQSPVILASTPL